MIRARRRVCGLLVVALAVVAAGAAWRNVRDAAPTTAVSTTATMAASPAPGPPGNPWPQIGTAPGEHHAILAIGDSLMGQTVFTLPGVLTAHGFDAVVYDGHVNASGLLDPMNGVSPRDWFEQQLTAHPDVDTVMFEWAGVCASACGPGRLRYGSPEFYAAWQAAARDLVDNARRLGLLVLWAISPPPPPDVHGEGFAEKSQVATRLTWYERRYPTELGITVADWWEALSDTSRQWRDTLWYDARLHTVRASDRVHISEDGSTRTSTWTVAALVELYAP